MKGFAFVLLCALVAVQARYTGLEKSTRALAALGDNPGLVHLRIAISTSGLLNTCAGTLITDGFVLTASECVSDSRFIWIRYGAVNVINPSLVTENSIVTHHSDNSIALITINRVVEFTNFISPVLLANDKTETTSPAKLCIFGENDSGDSGEVLNCYEVSWVQEDSTIVASSDEVAASTFDLGAGLVKDGVQYGVLTQAADDENAGTFTAVSGYLSWIEEVTGVDLNPEDDDDDEVTTESPAVHFVN